MLEIGWLPVSSGRILGGHEGIRDHLPTHGGGSIAMRHVRDKWEPPYVLEESFIETGTAACREGPHDILAIVDINVIADQDQPVDGVPSLVVEDHVPNPLGEFFRGRLHCAKPGRINTQGNPGHLGFEGGKGIRHRKSALLADLADLSGRQRSNQGVL